MDSRVRVGAETSSHAIIREGRKVSLATVQSSTYSYRDPGDFIEVRVVYSYFANRVISGRQTFCDFIFADEHSHVSAVLFCSPGLQEAPEVFSLLQEGHCYRIRYFEVLWATPHEINAHSQSAFVLRDQCTRLKLRHRTTDFEEITDSNHFPLLKHVPFKFTNVEHVNGDLHNGQLIDLLAIVQTVEYKVTKNGQQFQVIYLVEPQSSSSAQKVKSLRVALFNSRYQGTFNLGSVYALSNILVEQNPNRMFSTLNMRDSSGSVIIQVTNDADKMLNCQESKVNPLVDHERGGQEVRNTIIEMTQPATEVIPSAAIMRTSTHNEIKAGFAALNIGSNSGRDMQSLLESPVRGKRRSPIGIIPSPPKKLRPITLLEDEPVQSNAMICPNSSVNDINAPKSDEVLLPEFDFVNQMDPLEVIVTPAKNYMDTSPKDYFMRSKIRGMALIINNFFPGTDNERKGSYFDVVYLTEYLKKCNFIVDTKRDLKSWEYRDAIKEFKRKVEAVGSDYFDSLFIAVSSHGVYGAIEMEDEVKLHLYNDLIYQFDETNYPILEGKPKVFVIEACQEILSQTPLLRKVMTPPDKINLRNIIICNSSSPGLKSYRDVYLGSHFIYVLVNILMRHSHNRDFEQMLEMTQDALTKVKSEMPQNPCCWIPHRFKKLYFNPGL